MSSAVNPRRKYDGSRRLLQAKATRVAVLNAANRMFVERGYAATTVAAVAEAADVSVETVYKHFKNKPGLAKACFDVAIVGDDEPVPLVGREMVAAVQAEPDPRKKLRIYCGHLRETAPRTGPIQLVVRAAASTDPTAGDLWGELLAERLAGMAEFADHLKRSKSLRKGVTADDARDVLFLLISVEVWELLVVQRGWSTERYADWVCDQLVAALL